MRSHKILEHTADLRLLCEGSTLEDLFTAAFEGMSEIIKKEYDDSQQGVKKEIKLAAADETALLIDFLSEVLTQSHVNRAVFINLKIKKIKSTEIDAEIYGYKSDGFDEDIKAVTYHEAQIRKNIEGNLETIIVFDI
jgi:SHS2 domain-containing protein